MTLKRNSKYFGAHDYGMLGSLAKVPLLTFEQISGCSDPMQEVSNRCEELIERLIEIKEWASMPVDYEVNHRVKFHKCEIGVIVCKDVDTGELDTTLCVPAFWSKPQPQPTGTDYVAGVAALQAEIKKRIEELQELSDTFGESAALYEMTGETL